MVHELLRIAIFVAGLLLVMATLLSAICTFVLPRGVPDFFSAAVFTGLRHLFYLRLHWARSYEVRDRVMALYAPIALFCLLPVWLLLITIGYTAMYWALGVVSWSSALTSSGSSLLTLGYASGKTLPYVLLEFTEATWGLLLVALLIAYLPTMYSAFSRRETAVTQLTGRAGSPPSALEMILRLHRIGDLTRLRDFWIAWETLFAEIEESHTSFPALVFFRSPQPGNSWITAAGTVMDTAALLASTVDIPRQPQAEVCIRAGYLALRRIADFYRLSYDPDASYPATPISITREEFAEFRDALAAQGVPLKPDQEQAWRDFAGWRVNYDRVLIAISALIVAPYAPWSSDRSLASDR